MDWILFWQIVGLIILVTVCVGGLLTTWLDKKFLETVAARNDLPVMSEQLQRAKGFKR